MNATIARHEDGYILDRPDGTWQLFWTRREAEAQARAEGLPIDDPDDTVPFGPTPDQCQTCSDTGIIHVKSEGGYTARACPDCPRGAEQVRERPHLRREAA